MVNSKFGHRQYRANRGGHIHVRGVKGVVVQVRELNREHLRGRYYIVAGNASKTHSPAYRKYGRVYVKQDVTGNNLLLQDVAAFEAMLAKDTPKYYAQLEAFRLAASLGLLDKYFNIAEKHPYSSRIRKLVQIETGELVHA